MAKAKTRTYTKYVHQLTAEEYLECYQLNLGSMGLMREKLVRERKREISSAKVFLLKDLETKKVLSWSIVFNHFQGDGAYFYTAPTFRRNGYGKRIAKHVQKHNPEVRVFPCNEINQNFFAKTKFKNLDWSYY